MKEGYRPYLEPTESVLEEINSTALGLSEAEAAAVTNLGTVFENNINITSFNELSYFTGLTSIEENAFCGCSNLTSLVIPNSVNNIGEEIIKGCTNLTSLTIPNSVKTIGAYAF